MNNVTKFYKVYEEKQVKIRGSSTYIRIELIPEENESAKKDEKALETTFSFERIVNKIKNEKKVITFPMCKIISIELTGKIITIFLESMPAINLIFLDEDMATSKYNEINDELGEFYSSMRPYHPV